MLSCGAIKILSWKHIRQSAVEGPLSKERRSSEARRRRASLLVYIIESVCLFVCLFVRGKRKNYGTD